MLSEAAPGGPCRHPPSSCWEGVSCLRVQVPHLAVKPYTSVCARVRVCVRACVCAFVCACVCMLALAYCCVVACMWEADHMLRVPV